MTRCWTIDLQNYGNDTIATIFKARANNSEMDHRYFYARYDGSEWASTYLCKAGWKLYSSEQDYVGLGALDPNNPNIIYISTPFDPRDDAELGVREIFKGETTDRGATWTWTPITQNSTRNNYRPIVPAWDGTNTALLWMRGTYNTAQIFDMAIVGIIDRPYETFTLMNYVDATTVNTVFSDDSLFTPTGPDTGQGASDDQWHERTGFGNGSSVFTSAEVGGENAPTLKTIIKATSAGSFDVWVNFWADPDADWRIEAGLEENNMQVFRHMACKQVEDDVHTLLLELSGDNNTFLYQAYLGKVTAEAADSTFEVFVDDEAIQTGTTSTLIGDIARTWYDGISYTSSLFVTVPDKQVELEDTANSMGSFRIYSNTGWAVSASESWLDLSLPAGSGNDTLIITAEENTLGYTRVATISVSADNIEPQFVRVYQRAASPSLIISDEALTVGATANSTATFSITSNTVWNVASSQAWLNVNQATGINDANITLTAALNPDNATREATVTITATTLEDKIITVTQDAYVLLGVSTHELTIGAYESSTASFNVISNTSWSIDINESWLTANTLAGSDKTAITLTAGENPLNETREAIVTVSADGADDQTVTVTQAIPTELITSGNRRDGYVYPNPATNTLYVEITSLPATIRLYTLDGKQLVLFEAKDNLSEIDLRNLDEGIYILQIMTQGSNFIFKIAKE